MGCRAASHAKSRGFDSVFVLTSAVVAIPTGSTNESVWLLKRAIVDCSGCLRAVLRRTLDPSVAVSTAPNWCAQTVAESAAVTQRARACGLGSRARRGEAPWGIDRGVKLPDKDLGC
jgi:hypothetical protein